MSDDIDRLKTVLEQLQRVVDTLQDDHDAMCDVVGCVRPVELETDPEGHAALRQQAHAINMASCELRAMADYVEATVNQLLAKARLT